MEMLALQLALVSNHLKRWAEAPGGMYAWCSWLMDCGGQCVLVENMSISPGWPYDAAFTVFFAVLKLL